MNRLQAACRRALCLPIRAYQHTLSPWIGRSCRFTPSCSNYTMQAILTHGQMGLRPGAGSREVDEPRPQAAAVKTV